MTRALTAIVLALMLSGCFVGDLEDQIDEWKGLGPQYVTPDWGLVIYNHYDLPIPTAEEWDAEVSRVTGLYARRVPQEYWSTRYVDNSELEVHIMERRWAEKYGVGALYSPGVGITIWLGHPDNWPRTLDDTHFGRELGWALTQCCAGGWVKDKYGVP